MVVLSIVVLVSAPILAYLIITLKRATKDLKETLEKADELTTLEKNGQAILRENVRLQFELSWAKARIKLAHKEMGRLGNIIRKQRMAIKRVNQTYNEILRKEIERMRKGLNEEVGQDSSDRSGLHVPVRDTDVSGDDRGEQHESGGVPEARTRVLHDRR